MKSNFKDNYKDKKPTAISEIYEQKGSMTDEEFEKFIIESGARGSFMVYRSKNKDEELGKELRNVPGKEQLEIFAIILILLVLEIMYDSLFIYGIIEGWDQQFLSFTLAMAFMILGLMIDFYRRSFLPDVLELKKRSHTQFHQKHLTLNRQHLLQILLCF